MNSSDMVKLYYLQQKTRTKEEEQDCFFFTLLFTLYLGKFHINKKTLP